MPFFKSSTVNNSRSIFATTLFMFCTFTSLNVMSNDCDGFNDKNGNCNSSGVFVPDYGLTHPLSTDRDDSKIVIYDTTLFIGSNNKARINLNLSQDSLPDENDAWLLFNANTSSVTLLRNVPESLGGGNSMVYESYDKIELPKRNDGNGDVIVRNEIVKVRIAVNQHFLWLSVVTTELKGAMQNVQSATFFTGISRGAFLALMQAAKVNSYIRIADYAAFKNEIARDCAKILRQRSCNTTSISKIFSILNHHHIN